MKTLSIVFSFRNEEGNIEPLIRRISNRPLTLEANTQFLFRKQILFAATYRTFSTTTGFNQDTYPWSFALGFKPNRLYEFCVSADLPGFGNGFALNNFYEVMFSMGFD